MSTLLDTNILARLAKPDHPQHALAKDAVRLLLRTGEQICVVPQNLYEFWAVATRPLTENGLGMSPSGAQREVSQIKRLFTLLRNEGGILTTWERLVRDYEVKGKAAHDARLVAAMNRHGISQLLTFNADHFARFREIVVLTPDTVLHGK